MPHYSHILGIGATGMLAGAAVHLAGNSKRQTLVARHASEFVREAGLVNAIAIDVDWHDTDAFIDAIALALERDGPADLCLLWLHQSAAATLAPLLELLGQSDCRLIHVMGSSSADPREQADTMRQKLAVYPAIRYHSVALGSVLEAGTRRWLTHDEIANGVIACESEDRDIVVGAID